MSAAAMVIIILASIILVFVFILLIIKHASGQSKRLARECTALTTGVVKKVTLLDDGKRVTAEYTVNGVTYKRAENIGQYKDTSVEPRADGGRKKSRYREYIVCKAGDPIAIMYDPHKPSRAYFRDNKGRTFYR